MRIKKIRIRNFGQFHNREFTFAPGLNVIYGENESVKKEPILPAPRINILIMFII